MKSNQLGRTMMEALMYLGIIGSLATATAVLVGRVQDRYKGSKASTQIEDLRKNINARFATVGDYSKVGDIEKLVEEKVIPATMARGSDKKLLHAYNGEVILASANQGGSNRSYTITYKDVPKKACVEMANIRWFSEDSSDLVRIKINSKTFEWPYKIAGSDDTLPLSTKAALAACSKTDNELVWEFL